MKFFPKRLYIFLFMPIVFIGVHYIFYFTTSKLMKADKSINPKATNYFIHANVVSTLWITAIHDYLFVDYDSVVLKPLVSWSNYLFTKGEKNLKEENAEDAVWWYLTYARMYNLTTPLRDDISMSMYDMPKMKQLELREKIYRYSMNITKYGVKGVEFGKYEEGAVNTFINQYYYGIYELYEGHTKKEQINNYWHDETLHHKIVNIYDSYKRYIYKKKTTLSNNNYYILFEKSRRILYSNLYIKNIDNIGCSSVYIEDFLLSYKFLLIDYDNVINNQLFYKHYVALPKKKVLDSVKESCSKYQFEVSEIENLLIKIKGINNGK